MRHSMLFRLVLLTAFVAFSSANACDFQGYQCDEEESLNCVCHNEERCGFRRSQDFASDVVEGADALRKGWGGGRTSNGGGGTDSCRTVTVCDESFRETCSDLGCNDRSGKCIDTTDVCGTRWEGDYSNSFCNFKSSAYGGYVSWLNHMSNTNTACSGIPGENCEQRAARNDGTWFMDTLRSMVLPAYICDKTQEDAGNAQCFSGTIPSDLEILLGDAARDSDFFATQTSTTFRYDDASVFDRQSGGAQVTVIPSECPTIFDTFSCARNIPACDMDGEVGKARNNECYSACNAVTACLDAFLLHCITLANTPAGLGDCEGFDWSTASSGATCNPGFFCQGVQKESTALARDVRNCDQGTEMCQDRPYMMEGGFCVFGQELPNLCAEFQQHPDNELSDGDGVVATKEGFKWTYLIAAGFVLVFVGTVGFKFWRRRQTMRMMQQQQVEMQQQHQHIPAYQDPNAKFPTTAPSTAYAAPLDQPTFSAAAAPPPPFNASLAADTPPAYNDSRLAPPPPYGVAQPPPPPPPYNAAPPPPYQP